MDCPWCEDRPRLAQEVQDSINAARMRDYLERLRQGDTAALAPALTFSARLPGSARQIAETMAKTA